MISLRKILSSTISAGARTKTEEGLSGPPEIAELETYSMAGPRILNKLYVLAEDVIARNVAGDFVECGVCNGGSAAVIASAFRDTDRRIWLYDSFQGLPAPGEVDGPSASVYTGRCIGSEEKVKEAMRVARFPEQHCIIRKGWFQDTFQSELPEAVSFLHIDSDWYESVMLSLATFYDRVVEGGVIVLDDFGHWEGCREAFYDFAQARALKPLLERFGHTQAFWVKGRTHNRNASEKWICLDPLSS